MTPEDQKAIRDALASQGIHLRAGEIVRADELPAEGMSADGNTVTIKVTLGREVETTGVITAHAITADQITAPDYTDAPLRDGREMLGKALMEMQSGRINAQALDGMLIPRWDAETVARLEAGRPRDILSRLKRWWRSQP